MSRETSILGDEVMAGGAERINSSLVSGLLRR